MKPKSQYWRYFPEVLPIVIDFKDNLDLFVVFIPVTRRWALCMIFLLPLHDFKWNNRAKCELNNELAFCFSFSCSPLFLPLFCNVVLFLCASLSSSLPTFGSGHLSLMSKPLLRLFTLFLCADRPRSPLTHGCRSTHNSPVHSACSSQRLSQNFSVSVPTLIFTGTQRQGRSSVHKTCTNSETLRHYGGVLAEGEKGEFIVGRTDTLIL